MVWSVIRLRGLWGSLQPWCCHNFQSRSSLPDHILILYWLTVLTLDLVCKSLLHKRWSVCSVKLQNANTYINWSTSWNRLINAIRTRHMALTRAAPPPHIQNICTLYRYPPPFSPHMLKQYSVPFILNTTITKKSSLSNTNIKAALQVLSASIRDKNVSNKAHQPKPRAQKQTHMICCFVSWNGKWLVTNRGDYG